MEYIKRAIEDVVKDSAMNFKAVLVTGARQTGKSTLLKHLYPEIKEISFDDPFVEENVFQGYWFSGIFDKMAYTGDTCKWSNEWRNI